MAKNKLSVSEVKILRHLAKYDPELAEELASSEEPLEEKIATELMFVRMIKQEKIKQLDLETLLATFDLWNEMMKRAIQYISSCNAFFMTNFIEQYAFIAKTVEERIKTENPPPDPRAMLVFKGLELLDEMKEHTKKLMSSTYNVCQPSQPIVEFYSEENKKEEADKNATKKRKKKSKSKAKAKA